MCGIDRRARVSPSAADRRQQTAARCGGATQYDGGHRARVDRPEVFGRLLLMIRRPPAIKSNDRPPVSDEIVNHLLHLMPYQSSFLGLGSAGLHRSRRDARTLAMVDCTSHRESEDGRNKAVAQFVETGEHPCQGRPCTIEIHCAGPFDLMIARTSRRDCQHRPVATWWGRSASCKLQFGQKGTD